MSYAYVGRKLCGCICFAIMDDPDHVKSVATEVAKAIRKGLTIERVQSDVVNREWVGWNCPHEPKPVESNQLKLWEE